MAAAGKNAQPKELTRMTGIVKMVMSGDTIVIRGEPRGGPPPERTLSFSGVSAPRLERRANRDGEDNPKDEPFAWESREFLRTKLVGRKVTFVVEYKVTSGREYGTVYVGSTPTQMHNVTHMMISEGLLKIRDGARGGSEEHAELVKLQAAAQDAEKGMWAKPDEAAKHVRNISWNVDNARALVDSCKGKPVDAIIEHVRDGCTLRGFILPSFQYVTVMLTGIKTDVFRRGEDGKETAEPFAHEAKFFTESRLLQRNVQILLEGESGSNLLGTVMHPAGNISEFLLVEGLAQVVDWSIGKVTHNREKYRAAENAAKKQRKRMWKSYVAPASQTLPLAEKQFSGTVEEIVNPECVVVATAKGPRKIFLASIRQPRPQQQQPAGPASDAGSDSGRPGRRGRSMFDIPYAFEAREFLRKKLIGQKVNVSVDYIKPANEGYPEKICATIMVGDIDVGEALVSKGYATVVRYKSGDDQRSTRYDDLLAAEARAVKNGKGVHNKKEAVLTRVSEINNKAMGDRFLPSLKRAGRMTAVVEFVSSGSRLRVYAPKETALFQVLLAGINCPRSGSGTTPGEPFGDEAQQLVRKLCLQHEVEVEVYDADRNGNMIGAVFAKGGSLALKLVEEGLAKVHFTADRYPSCQALFGAEERAKEIRKGVWEKYTGQEEAQAAAAEAAIEETERKTNYKKVVVTEVEDPTTLWVQFPDSAKELDELMNTIATHFKASPPAPGHIPKKGEVCAAKFSADGNWYRAKVVAVSGRSADVLYIDYGNSETVSVDDIASLPVGTQKLEPQGKRFRIALLASPPADYVDEAKGLLTDKVLWQQLKMNVEYKDGGEEYASFLAADDSFDVAEGMLAAGYGIVAHRRERSLQDLIAKYKAAQQAAHDDRLGAWIYGDVVGDDAREFGYTK